MLRNSRDIIRRLEREDFVLVGVRGSHHQYKHGDGRKVSVPHPRRDIAIGTVYSIYQQARWAKD
jgi:predicted RNA binding protein YcfA (HicA-like mRNA interferase family)